MSGAPHNRGAREGVNSDTWGQKKRGAKALRPDYAQQVCKEPGTARCLQVLVETGGMWAWGDVGGNTQVG